MNRAERTKQCGIFKVEPVTSRFSFLSPSAGIDMREGDRYLHLELPPVSREKRSIDAARQSLGQIAQRAADFDEAGDYMNGLYGFTYIRHARLAALALGFKTSSLMGQIPFSNKRIAYFQDFYRKHVDPEVTNAEIGSPVIIFMDRPTLNLYVSELGNARPCTGLFQSKVIRS